MQWLKDDSNDLEEGALVGMKYTVFGLGNTQYEHYNKMGKDVDARMDELGATRVYRYGEGDDDGSLEDDFEEWKAELWGSLCRSELGVELARSDLVVAKKEYDFKVVDLPGEAKAMSLRSGMSVALAAKKYFEAVPAKGGGEPRAEAGHRGRWVHKAH